MNLDFAETRAPSIVSPWGDVTPPKFSVWLLENSWRFDKINNTEDLYRALRWAYIEGAVDSAVLLKAGPDAEVR